MAKYINRDELAEWLKRIPLKDLSNGLGPCRVIMEEDFKRAILAIPDGTIVDLEQVVRCEGCKYWQDNNDGYPHEECRWGHGETPDGNDFCSHGERKDGDSDAKES